MITSLPRSKTGSNYVKSGQRMSRGETEIMDGPLEGRARDMGHDGPQNQDHTENANAQPEQSSATVDHTESTAEEAPGSDRTGLESSDLSLTDDVSANENYRLIPQQESTPNHTLRAAAATVENPVSSLQNGHTLPKGLTNGALPICTPPTASAGRPGSVSPQSPKGNGQAPAGKKRLPSTSTNSQHSLKTTAAQIQQVAGDDLCATIVLACLFCQLWDCLLAMGEGCHLCVSSFCSSLCSLVCCCDPSVLDPLLAGPQLCCGSCLEPVCSTCGSCGGATCDCSVCDLCLQATECLELGMEVSQLLFH
ncbi:hypothetical protein AAFF_G00059620 [Aldrovandia affinis]|uniref:MyoD family inhibitor-like n=1 Tax=Aldrovandia affinis TaxID=143900 RepID=A0AAD7S004_9TELE|nr:hypothetical protein AAFF_G00059620 [Aldrovandia affinis]